MQSFFKNPVDKIDSSLANGKTEKSSHDFKLSSEKEIIKISLTNQIACLDYYYALVMYLHSPEIVTKILSFYNLNCERSSSGLYTLEQNYKGKSSAQLAHLLYFLCENKYIQSEQHSLLSKKINYVKLCADSELTALFYGYSLLKTLEEKLTMRIDDPFYDSQDMARTPSSLEADREFMLNQLRYEIIQKCKALYQYKAYDLLKRLLSDIQKAVPRFGERDRKRLLALVPEYQNKLLAIETVSDRRSQVFSISCD